MKTEFAELIKQIICVRSVADKVKLLKPEWQFIIKLKCACKLNRRLLNTGCIGTVIKRFHSPFNFKGVNTGINILFQPVNKTEIF